MDKNSDTAKTLRAFLYFGLVCIIAGGILMFFGAAEYFGAR